MAVSTMKAVLRQTGLTPDRLRIWEKRYGAVRPARAESGRRVYSDAEVHRLKLLMALVERGHSIGTIARLSDEELLRKIGTSTPARKGLGPEIADLVTSLADFDLAQIRIDLARLRHSTSPREFAFEIVPHLMLLVGKAIENKSFSIAQEHALSEILHGHLMRIYDDLAPLEGMRPADGVFLFCTREGDPHDFGLMMAAIASRAAGVRTHYIGPNLPIEALANAAKKLKPRAVVLGLASIPDADEKVSPAKYLAALDARIDDRTEVWIGGSAVRAMRRPKWKRTVFIFESIADLEEKLNLLGPRKE